MGKNQMKTRGSGRGFNIAIIILLLSIAIMFGIALFFMIPYFNMWSSFS